MTQIQDYAFTRTNLNLTTDDLIDVNATDDGGTTYNSAKLSVGDLISYISANADTFYTADGALSGARTVTAGGNETTFLGGDITVEMNNALDNYGFQVKDDGGVIQALLGYNQVDTAGFLQLSEAGVIYFTAEDGRVGIGQSVPIARLDIQGEGTTNATRSINIEDSALNPLFYIDDSGVVNSENGYSISDTLFLDRFDSGVGAAYILLGDTAAVTAGSNGGGIAIGASSSAFGEGVAIGFSAAASTFNTVALGRDATASGTHSIAIGRTTSAGQTASIALGFGATTTLANQFVVGGDGFRRIDDIYMGGGVSDTVANMAATTYHATGVNTGVIDGSAGAGELRFAGARGTGSGVGGDIIFLTAPAGASGSAQNALVEQFRIRQNGRINMANLPTSSAGLATGDIWNNSGVINIV